MLATDPRRTSPAAAPAIDVTQLVVPVPRGDELYKRFRRHFGEVTMQEQDAILPPLLRAAGDWLKAEGLLNTIRAILDDLQNQRDDDMRSLRRPYTLSIVAIIIDDSRIYEAVMNFIKTPPAQASGNA